MPERRNRTWMFVYAGCHTRIYSSMRVPRISYADCPEYLPQADTSGRLSKLCKDSLCACPSWHRWAWAVCVGRCCAGQSDITGGRKQGNFPMHCSVSAFSYKRNQRCAYGWGCRVEFAATDRFLAHPAQNF